MVLAHLKGVLCGLMLVGMHRGLCPDSLRSIPLKSGAPLVRSRLAPSGSGLLSVPWLCPGPAGDVSQQQWQDDRHPRGGCLPGADASAEDERQDRGGHRVRRRLHDQQRVQGARSPVHAGVDFGAWLEPPGRSGHPIRGFLFPFGGDVLVSAEPADRLGEPVPQSIQPL